ncbi:MAG: EAL domain-containing protein [Myxococcota bacterium]|nr:EAL domain-containing protein [Myxococcota bacterium]MDW8363515.1 EAL domain-containing protein [Myxococcales bacterium]
MSRNFTEWLRSQTIDRQGRAVRPSDVPPMLAVGELRVVFQPIVDLHGGDVFAYEALVRSTSPHYAGPVALFEHAVGAACAGALGRVIRELAVERCPHMPLFLNVHPNELDEGWLVQPDDPVFRHEHPVYLEITESVPLSHFEFCHSTLAEVRSKGVLLAIDDLGAGYSNLKYIAELSPEIVKLDRGLAHGLHEDRRRQKLVTQLVRLCEELGAEVVVEGIETLEELRAVADSGARFGQGYVFARPEPEPPEPDRRAVVLSGSRRPIRHGSS